MSNPIPRIIHFDKFHEMLNIDDRILQELDESEYYLLSHIAKSMNQDGFTFPKNKTLCDSTNWNIKKVQRVKKRLIDKKTIEIVERYTEKGRQTSNGYRILTDAISVFINLKNKGVRDIPQNGIGDIPQNGIGDIPQNGIGDIPQNGIPILSIRSIEEIRSTEDNNGQNLDFDRFWNLYDLKKKKAKCLTKWNRLSKKQKAAIFEHVPKYIESAPDKQYRMHPLTYLNGQCWNDEIIERKKVIPHPAQHSTRQKIASGQDFWSDKDKQDYL